MAWVRCIAPETRSSIGTWRLKILLAHRSATDQTRLRHRRQEVVTRLNEATRRAVFEGILACALEVRERAGRRTLVFGRESWPCLERLAVQRGLSRLELTQISNEGLEKWWDTR